jgi:hypothetical protein
MKGGKHQLLVSGCNLKILLTNELKASFRWPKYRSSSNLRYMTFVGQLKDKMAFISLGHVSTTILTIRF